jgi:hypothetical protein
VLFTVIDAHDFSVTLDNTLSSIKDAGQWSPIWNSA